MLAVDLEAPRAVVESAVAVCGLRRGAEGDEGGEGAEVDVGVEEREEQVVGRGDGRPGAGADWELQRVVSTGRSRGEGWWWREGGRGYETYGGRVGPRE